MVLGLLLSPGFQFQQQGKQNQKYTNENKSNKNISMNIVTNCSDIC